MCKKTDPLKKIRNKIQYEIDLEIYMKTIELFKIEKELRKINELKGNVSLLKNTCDFYFEDKTQTKNKRKKPLIIKNDFNKNLETNKKKDEIIETVSLQNKKKEQVIILKQHLQIFKVFVETLVLKNENKTLKQKITVSFKEHEDILLGIFFHTPSSSKTTNCSIVKKEPFIYYVEEDTCFLRIDLFLKEGNVFSISHQIDSLKEDLTYDIDKKNTKEYFISNKQKVNTFDSKTPSYCLLCGNLEKLTKKNFFEIEEKRKLIENTKIKNKNELCFFEEEDEKIRLLYPIEKKGVSSKENEEIFKSYLLASTSFFIKELIFQSTKVFNKKTIEKNEEKLLVPQNIIETIQKFTKTSNFSNKFDFLLDDEN